MMDASDNMTKLVIATTIYLVVAIMVAAGLTVRGTSIAAGDERATGVGFQQAGLAHDHKGVPGNKEEDSAGPEDGGQFESLDAKALIAPAVQAIITSKRHIIF